MGSLVDDILKPKTTSVKSNSTHKHKMPETDQQRKPGDSNEQKVAFTKTCDTNQKQKQFSGEKTNANIMRSKNGMKSFENLISQQAQNQSNKNVNLLVNSKRQEFSKQHALIMPSKVVLRPHASTTSSFEAYKPQNGSSGQRVLTGCQDQTAPREKPHFNPKEFKLQKARNLETMKGFQAKRMENKVSEGLTNKSSVAADKNDKTVTDARLESRVNRDPRLARRHQSTTDQKIKANHDSTSKIDPRNKMVDPRNKMINPRNKMVDPRNKMVDPRNKMINPKNTTVDSRNKMIDCRDIKVNTQNRMVDHRNKIVDPVNKVIKPVNKMNDPRNKTIDQQNKKVLPFKNKRVDPRAKILPYSKARNVQAVQTSIIPENKTNSEPRVDPQQNSTAELTPNLQNRPRFVQNSEPRVDPQKNTNTRSTPSLRSSKQRNPANRPSSSQVRTRSRTNVTPNYQGTNNLDLKLTKTCPPAETHRPSNNNVSGSEKDSVFAEEALEKRLRPRMGEPPKLIIANPQHKALDSRDTLQELYDVINPGNSDVIEPPRVQRKHQNITESEFGFKL